MRSTRRVAELGFSVNVFARSLKANRSMTVGVLLPTISSPFFGRVVASLELILRRSGYECFVCSYDFDREQELGKLAFLARYHVDGIVYVPEHATRRRASRPRRHDPCRADRPVAGKMRSMIPSWSTI